MTNVLLLEKESSIRFKVRSQLKSDQNYSKIHIDLLTCD